MAAGVTEIARMFPGLSIHIFGGASDGIGGRIRAKFGDIWCRNHTRPRVVSILT